MPNASAHLYWLIVGCEAAFWLLLMLALFVRYVLQRNELSRLLLFALPVADVLLLAFTASDLRAGTPATFAHGLATAYVGFTIAFGGVAVRWADRRFAHRFAGGPAPAAAPKYGWPAVRYEFALWLRCIVAWAITAALLIGLIVFVDSETVARSLSVWFGIASVSIVAWLVFGPLWSLLFFRRQAAE